MSLESDVQRLWDAVVRQGSGMTKLEPLVGRIKDAVNNQAVGLRNLEQRVGQLEGILMRAAHQGRPGPQPQMRSINSAPLRALPSVSSMSDFVEVDDVSADSDYDDDQDEVG